MERQKYNELILDTLSKLIKKYPDLRFGQILFNSDIIKHIQSDKGTIFIEDPFYEESEVTWKRILNNKFAFNEQYN
jgi:hypothetical protein